MNPPGTEVGTAGTQVVHLYTRGDGTEVTGNIARHFVPPAPGVKGHLREQGSACYTAHPLPYGKWALQPFPRRENWNDSRERLDINPYQVSTRNRETNHLILQIPPRMAGADSESDLLCPEDLNDILEWEPSSELDATAEDNGSTTSTPQDTTDTSSQGRNWCFTLNNPTTEEISNLHTSLPNRVEFRFMVFQLEQGELQTPHVQGYVEFNRVMRFNRVKSLISPRIYLNQRRGTRQQAADYCRKEEGRIEGPWEYGQGPSQGRRTDLDEIRDAIDAGTTLDNLWTDHFSSMIRYSRGVKEYLTMKTPQRTFKTQVHIAIGPPGTGKSRWVLDTFPGAYWKQRGEWWDGYDRHKTVVMDDFYGWIKYDTLLRLCDRYPLLVETKGGQANFVAETIIITSNKEPWEWYSRIPDMGALYRRITKWHKFNDIHTEYDNYEEYISMN